MWFTTRETSLTTIDLNALHCRSPRLVSKNKQSGRSKRQPPERLPQMETLVIVCGKKAKQNETPTSVLHHVGWSFWQFFSCDDESILNTSVIMKTLQIHRTADTSILCIKTQALANWGMGYKLISNVHFYVQNECLHFETNSMNAIEKC